MLILRKPSECFFHCCWKYRVCCISTGSMTQYFHSVTLKPPENSSEVVSKTLCSPFHRKMSSHFLFWCYIYTGLNFIINPKEAWFAAGIKGRDHRSDRQLTMLCSRSIKANIKNTTIYHRLFNIYRTQRSAGIHLFHVRVIVWPCMREIFMMQMVTHSK